MASNSGRNPGRVGRWSPLGHFRALGLVLTVVSGLLLSQTAHAESPSMWRREWPTFSPV
jgi:hypothetical protein